MALPQDTTTIEDFIQSGRQTTIDYIHFSFLEKLQNGTVIASLNIISDYIEELRNACVNVQLSQEQQQAYFYKPKLLCYDIYGSPEVYYIILLINDMADVKEFTKPVIKLLRKEHMSMILSAIYNAEIDAIKSYNERV